MSIRNFINAVEQVAIVENKSPFQTYLAPADTSDATDASVFLAGSIDMGAAVDWQKEVTEALSGLPVAVFNPRRDDWDSSWKQDITDDKFREQVEWEHDHMEKAKVIAFYFDPKGKAPITLMELGMHCADGKAIVCCPEGYWRRGNVQVLCDRHDIPMVDTLDDLIDAVKGALMGDRIAG